MTIEEALSACTQELADPGTQVEEHDGDVVIRCEPGRVHEVLRRLREGELSCHYFGFLTAVDYPPGWDQPKRRGHSAARAEGGEAAGPGPSVEAPGGASAKAAEAQEPTDQDPGHLDLVYQVSSVSQRVKVFVYARVDRAEPRVQSVVDIYPGANWHERECYDLFGVVFEGHPYLRRILLPDEWIGYPLRKDYDYTTNDLLYVPEKRWPEVAEERKI